MAIKKKIIPQTVFEKVEDIQFNEVKDESFKTAAADRLASALNDFIDEYNLPGWKRSLCGCILGILIAGAVGYGIGTVFSFIVINMLIGVLLNGASVALAMMIYWLSLLITMLSAGFVGGYLGRAAANYVITKKIDAHYDIVKNKVSSLFRREVKV